MDYEAPLADISFILNDVFQAYSLWQSYGFSKDMIDSTVIQSILSECSRFATDQIAPLNRTGDEIGARLENGQVKTPPGFKDAYKLWASHGWIGLTGNPEYGGMGMPKALDLLVQEMLFAANPSFTLYPVLTSGGAFLLNLYADQIMKEKYLPNIYEGKWSVTMCLTEGHAGSDLGLLTTKAQPSTDHSYLITGEKIFISGGDQDLTENILHLVLARLPDAPAGVKGISIFLVPKYLIDSDNQCSEKNNVECTGLEKKMGIKAAATCIITFNQAKGFLIGQPHHGLQVMFAMMNYERLSISIQGLGAGEAVYQLALAYAKERKQGRSPRVPQSPCPIIEHGDVRKMLMTIKAFVEAGRAFCFYVGLLFDQVAHSKEKDNSSLHEKLALLTPIAKAFVTDRGFEICVIAQQIFGGYGYIAEWGVEQYVRDVRIAQIYEGTNGIQALDFLQRKVFNNRASLDNLLQEMSDFIQKECQVPTLKEMGEQLKNAIHLFNEVTDDLFSTANTKKISDQLNSAAVNYLDVVGYILYGYLWLKMAAVALKKSNENNRKLKTAKFYYQYLLPRIYGLIPTLRADYATLFSLDTEDF